MFLAKVPLAKVPELDHKTLQRLQRLGVRTLGDLRKIPPREMQRSFRALGYKLQRLALGEDGDRVKPLWPPRSLGHQVEFEDETVAAESVKEALRQCAESLAKRLARNHEFCRRLTLTIGLADESYLQESERLSLPLDAEKDIHRASLRLLGRMRIEQPLLRVELRAADLGSGSGLQLQLLDENRHGRGLPHERKRSLDATLAFIRKRFGVGAVVTVAMMRQAKRIGMWTYPLGHMLNEPVKVATDSRGRPVRYWRRGSPRDVKSIQDHWKEAEWFWGSICEKTVYRVETDPSGLSELHLHGIQWRLCAVAD